MRTFSLSSKIRRSYKKKKKKKKIYIYIYIRGVYTSYSVKPPFVKTVWLPESGEPTQDKKNDLIHDVKISFLYKETDENKILKRKLARKARPGNIAR